MKIILTCCFALLSVPLFAHGLPDAPYVQVSGHGAVKVVPDMLKLHVSVQKVGDDIASTKHTVDQHTARAISAARKLGIAKSDITSAQIRISPRYDYSGDQQKLIGYRVSRQVAITLRDLDNYGPLLKNLVDAGINGINNVSMRYSQPARLRDKAFKKAVDDAHAKAARLASQFDSALGKVWSIDEVKSPSPQPMMARKSTLAAAPSVSEFAPGTVKVEARIKVVFRLESSAGQ